MAELKEFAIEFDRKANENIKKRAKHQQEMIKRLKEAKGIQVAPKGDKHAKRVKDLHERATRHDEKRKKK
jgi:hypothetical protein